MNLTYSLITSATRAERFSNADPSYYRLKQTVSGVNRPYEYGANISTMKEDGKIYVIKHANVYKPEQIGDEFKNKITVSGDLLTIESEDGEFKEVWQKK